MKKMVEEYSKWDKLPKDILQLIFERLGIVDRIRFELVCKGWRANTRQTPKLAWRLLSDEADCEQLTFFYSSESATHTFKLPEALRGGRFVVASNGWLVFAKGTELFDKEIWLYDPISSHQIPLPYLFTITSIFMLRYKDVKAFDQVAVSSPPAEASSSQCIVAVRFLHDPYLLALCTTQDDGWTIFRGKGYYFDHMGFCDGVLFALIDGRNPSFATHSITLGRGGCQLKMKLIPDRPPPEVLSSAEARPLRFCMFNQLEAYLVESKGQMWIFVRRLEKVMNTLDNSYDKIRSYEAMQIHATENAYIITNRLRNHAFLVDGVNCFSSKIKIGAFN